MPNRGRPSQDCGLCRERRVRCDLGRPACRRCLRYGAECPGYRDPQELVFRDETALTVTRGRRKRVVEAQGGSNSSDAISSKSHSSDGAATNVFFPLLSENPLGSMSQLPRATSSPTRPLPLLPLVRQVSEAEKPEEQTVTIVLPPSLPDSWRECSVPLLLDVYSTFDFIRDIYRIERRNGPLLWAAHLFNKTYLTNIISPVAVSKQSILSTQEILAFYHAKALSAVKTALDTPGGAFRDDILATVWVLASHELLVGSLSGTGTKTPWQKHCDGLLAILQARGTEILKTARGRTAFWPCYNMIQIKALVNNERCPPESYEWHSFIRKSLFPGEAYILYVAVFLAKVTEVLATVSTILHSRDFRAAEQQFVPLTEQLASAEQELSHYTMSAIRDYDHIDVYMRSLYMSAIIKGYSYTMLLTNFLTHYDNCKIPLERLKSEHSHCTIMAQTAAKVILDMLPCALYRLQRNKEITPRALFDGLKMVWPLTAVYVFLPTSATQKEEARKALDFIGKEIGVRQALYTRPDDPDWPVESLRPRFFGHDARGDATWTCSNAQHHGILVSRSCR